VGEFIRSSHLISAIFLIIASAVFAQDHDVSLGEANEINSMRMVTSKPQAPETNNHELKTSKGQTSEANPDFKIVTHGQATIPPAASAGPVYVVFFNSPNLTALLRDKFSQQGYTLAKTKTAAAIVVKMGSSYSFGRPIEHGAIADFGELFEDAAKERFSQAQAGVGELDQNSPGKAVFSAETIAAMLTNSIGESLFAAMSSSMGFNGWFNRIVRQDAKRVCSDECGKWAKYEQRLVLICEVSRQGILGSDSFRIHANAIDERLHPDAMFNRAMQELVRGLFEGGE